MDGEFLPRSVYELLIRRSGLSSFTMDGASVSAAQMRNRTETNNELLAVIPGEKLGNYTDDQKEPSPVAQFLASYIPIVSNGRIVFFE